MTTCVERELIFHGVDPVVMLPGMNCSSRLWAGLRLDAMAVPRLTEPTVDAQVARLLQQLPPRFALIGLSLGAVVAMALTRTAPTRVSRLALLATNARAPSRHQRAAWQQQRAWLAAGATAREVQREALPRLLQSSTVHRRPEVVEAALAMADEVGEAALDAQLRMQASRVDERPGLARVRCPTLVVAGRHDAMCSLDRHREIASTVADGRLTVLDAGHLSPLERPDEVATVLTAWLDDPQGTPGA